MKASEALKFFEASALRCPTCPNFSCDYCQRWTVMLSALRREAEREEQERPSYSLKEQIDDIESEFHGTDTAGNAAAATLRKLDEEGGKLLAELDRMIAAKRTIECVTWKPTADFLRSLGVEKKP